MKLFFMLYSNRSGSTLLSSILNKIEDISVSIESTFVSLLIESKIFESKPSVSKVMKIINKDPKLKEWDFSFNDLERSLLELEELSLINVINIILIQEFKLSDGIYIIKDPRLVNHLNEVIRFIPHVQFIQVIRDPRAVINSQISNKSSIGGFKMASGPYTASRSWLKTQKLISDQLNSQHIVVKYEDLINDEQQELKRICDLINISQLSLKDKTDYLDKIPDGQKHLHKLIGQGMKSERIFAWRNELTRKEMELIYHGLKKYKTIIPYDIDIGDRELSNFHILFFVCIERILHMISFFQNIIFNSSKRSYFFYKIKRLVNKNEK